MNDVSIQAIDAEIRESRAVVEVAESLDRLMLNRDFKTLIVKGFCEKEAIRLVQLRADPNMQTSEKQESIMKEIDAIAYLQSYFRTVQHKASLARGAIQAGEETREEMLKEGADV